MTTPPMAEGTGHARYTYRLRPSSSAHAALQAEWSRCRWIWNECVARSKKAHDAVEKCGPARLDRMLTEARVANAWLRQGSSVPQQQLIRDFGKSRAKALKDTKARLPMRQRAGMPGYKKKREALPTLNYTQHGRNAAQRLARYQRIAARRRPKRGQAGSKGYRQAKRQAAKLHKKVARQRVDTGRKWAKRVVRDHDRLAVEDFRPKFLAKSTMARKAADAAVGATKDALIHMARKHGRELHLVHPAHTTTDCAQCGARTKHALPLSERTYTCTACGAVSPRDKNSARVMLVRAGLNPAGADRARPAGPPVRRQREPGIPSPSGRGGCQNGEP
ncbi:RNA-guided endonuclease InsQ/TnpB family protein [Streptomyces mauvecolor]